MFHSSDPFVFTSLTRTTFVDQEYRYFITQPSSNNAIDLTPAQESMCAHIEAHITDCAKQERSCATCSVKTLKQLAQKHCVYSDDRTMLFEFGEVFVAVNLLLTVLAHFEKVGADMLQVQCGEPHQSVMFSFGEVVAYVMPLDRRTSDGYAFGIDAFDALRGLRTYASIQVGANFLEEPRYDADAPL